MPADADLTDADGLAGDVAGSDLSGDATVADDSEVAADETAEDIFVPIVGAVGFVESPTDAVAGVVFAPAIQIGLLDSDTGDPILSGAVATVTLSIGDGPAGAVLGGTTQLTTVAGVDGSYATFNNVSLSKAGTYTLIASAPGYGQIVSGTFTIVAAKAAKLAFVSQPQGGAAGTALTPQVEVGVEDAFGNPIVDATTTIAIKVGTGPTGAKLTGGGTSDAVAGIAVFDTLTLTKAGSGYTLVAFTDGLLSATSAEFVIAPGPPAQIGFLTQPADSVAGTPFSPAVKLLLKDAYGNKITTATDTVTVGLGANAGGATLLGKTAVAAVAGVASFPDLAVDKARTDGYTIVASAPGYGSATSPAFHIKAGAAAALAFGAQPKDAVAGKAVAVQVVVVDGLGNKVDTATPLIELSLASNPGGSTLGGSISAQAKAGVAEFTDIRLDKAGVGYQFRASGTNLGDGISAAFAITAGVATHLKVTGQPIDTVAGLPNVVTAEVHDEFGNLVDDSTLIVTLGVATNPGGASLAGQTTVQADAGRITFPDLALDRTGVGYSFSLAATGLTGALTNAFSVLTGPPAQIVLLVQPSDVVAGVAPSPVVTAVLQDALGNTVETSTAAVTLALGKNSAGATLAGDVTVTAQNGLAMWPNVALDRAGSGYTLVASAAGFGSVESTAFAVAVASAAALRFAVQPQSVLAGAAIVPSVEVRVEDAFGNTVTSAEDVISMALGSNPTSANLNGVTNVKAQGGVAHFSDLHIDKVGSGYTLVATAAKLSAVVSEAFPVKSGGPSRLAIVAQPGTMQAGVALAPPLTVAVLDANGNLVKDATTEVTLAIGANPGGGQLLGSNTVQAVAGIATFGDVRIDRAEVGYTLTVSAAAVTGDTSAPFTVEAGAAAKLVFESSPAGGVAGATLQPFAVAVEDAFGNKVTGSVVPITVGVAPVATLEGTTQVDTAGGVAVFADIVLTAASPSTQLVASAAGLEAAASTAFAVAAGAPARLVFGAQPAATTAGAPISPAFSVVVVDAYGNPTTASGLAVIVSVGANPSGASLLGAATVQTVQGVATFGDVSLDKVGSQYTLVAASGSLGSATSEAFDVTYTLPTGLAVATEAVSVVAGELMEPPIRIAVVDDFGNVVDGASLTVTLAFASNPGGAKILAGATAPAINGIATFAALRLDRAGTGYTLKATVNNLNAATTQPFDITAGAKSRLAVVAQPTAGVAGSPLNPGLVLEVQDAYGNRIYGAADIVTLQLGPAGTAATLTGAPAMAAVDGRLAYDNLTVDKTGANFTLTAAGDGLTAAVSAAIAIAPAQPYALAFIAQPGDVAAGVAMAPAVAVQVLDAYGNAVDTATNTVVLQIADNPSAGTLLGATSGAAVAGVAHFADVRIDKRGVGYSLLAQGDGLLAATSSSFNVNHGPGAVLVLTAQPSAATAGEALAPAVAVAVYDAYGNPATGEVHTIDLGLAEAPAGGALLGTVAAETVNGVAQFDGLSVQKAGSGYVVKATSTGLTSVQGKAFDVATAAATRLRFAAQPGLSVAGVPINPAVQVAVEDAFGNVVAAATPTVGIALFDNATGAVLSGTASAVASKGVATFANLLLDKVGSGYTLLATAPNLTSATSEAFEVQVSGDQRLVFTVNPGSAVAGSVLAPAVQVTIQDALGNVATSVTTPIKLSIGNNPGDAILGGTLVVTPVNGVATFGDVTLDKSGKGYTFLATAQAITAGVSAPFDVDANTASHLAFVAQPSNASSGAALAPAVQVAVVDDYGNVVPGATATVTLTLVPGTVGASLAGPAAVAAVGGTAVFSGISVDKAGSGYTLLASATGLTGTTSSAFQISAGAPSRLVISAQPQSAIAGAALAPAVVVSVRDAANNVVPTAVNPVSLAIASGPSGATLSGTTNAVAVAGSASFAGLVLTRAGTYTLVASSGTLTAATSDAFDVSAATPARLTFASQPSQTTAGAVIAPAMTVLVQDGYGNTVTSSTAVVALTLAANPSGATLLTGSSAAAVGGIATFADTSLDRSGSGLTLTASAVGLTSATSAPFSVIPAAADHLAFVAQPSSATAGAAMSPVVQVAVQDAFGNVVTSANPTISLTLGGAASGATILSGATATAVSGMASFGNIAIDRAGSGYALVAAATNLTPATSSTFSVSAGSASRLVFSVQPTATVAGTAINPALTVTVQDVWGNTVTGSSATVTIAIANNAGGGTLSGALTAAASGGIATFDNLRIDRSASGYTLLASSGSLTTATSAAFSVGFAGAAKLAFLVQPSNGSAGAALNPAVKLAVQDAFGNSVTTATPTITLSVASGPVGASYTASVDAIGGVATFGNVVLTKQGAGYTLGASGTGLTGATSTAFSMTFGAAAKLAFSVPPSDTVAGSPVTPVVKVNVLDAWDNLVTTATNSVGIAIGNNSGGATLAPQSASPVAGVASFASISLDKVGSGYTLVASSAQLSPATSEPFAVSPAAASRLAFSDQPANGVAGSNLAAFHVAVQDAFGNAVPGATPLVTVSLSANPGGATLLSGAAVTAAAGVATFGGVALDKAASGYRLAASAPNLAGATSDLFGIVAAAPSALAFTQQPSDVAAGSAMSPVKVAIEDAWGNIVLTAADSITLGLTTKPGGTVTLGGAKVAAISGVATFDALTLDKVGTPYRFTATTNTLTSPQSNAFAVNPAAASNLAFAQQPSNVVAGATMAAVKVNVLDPFGNLVTTGSPLVQLSVAYNVGGTLILTGATATASAGVATFSNLTFDKAGVGYTLAAASSGLSGDTSQAFTISAGTANKLAFSVQPSDVAAGKVMTPPQVVVQDAYGNFVASATPSVSLTLAVNPAAASILSGATSTAGSGVAVFGNLTLDKMGAGFRLGAASAGLAGATSGTFNITAGDAAKLAFTAQPATTAAGSNLAAVDVSIRDAWDNPVATATSSVVLTLTPAANGGTLAGTTTLAAVAGVAHFTDLHINKVGSGYGLSAASGALTGAASSSFAITPGTAAALAFSTQPSAVAAGVAMAPAVVVAVQDAFGNAVPTATPSITLALANNPAAGTLLDAATVVAVGGIATFDSIRVDKAGSGYTLAATASNLTPATSAAFDVSWGAIAKLAFASQPVSATANATLSPITVVVQDAFGNTVGNATTAVTLDFSVNPGSATLLGTTAVSAVGGIASFSTLRIQKAAVGYKLAATASGYTGAASNGFDITFGSASKFAFTKQPTNTSSGAILNPAVEVSVLDAWDNKVTSATTSVTLSIYANPGSATLSGTTTTAAVGGVATFADLSLDKVGTGYTLTAGGSLAAAISSTFNVAVGSSKKLVFTTQPASGTAGAGLANIAVSVQDGAGNLDTSSVASITLAIGTNPGVATLSGTRTVSAVGGVATFSGLSLNKSGNGYTLTATATGTTSGVSTAFNIVPGSASKIVVIGQPVASVVAGVGITQTGGQAVQVAIEDANDNIVTSATSTISLALDSNAFGATLGGTLSANAVAGVASFGTISVNKVGTALRLAASGSAGTAYSSNFDVTPATAAKLAFAVQPSKVSAGAAIAPAVKVDVQDAFGNTVTGSSAAIALAVDTGPVGATIAGNAASATNGSATFASLILTKAATGYRLTASSGTLASAVSQIFDVDPAAATNLAFQVAPSAVVSGASMSPAVVVAIRDDFGNTVTTATHGIGLALGQSPVGAILTGGSAVAASAGLATFAAVKLDKAGTYTLTASASGLTPVTSASLLVSAGAISAATSSVAASPATGVADGSSSVVLTATLRDANNNPVPGATVTFASTGTGNTVTQPTLTTNSSGQTSGSLVSTKAEAKTITASVGVTAYASTGVTFGPGAASAVTSTLSPAVTSATTDGGATIALTLTLKDANGNLIAGQAVGFAATGTANTFSATTGVTNASGQATFTLASTKAEAKTVSATVGGTTMASTAVSFTAGAANYALSTLTASPGSVTTDGGATTTLTATIRDVNGNPVAGQTVVFSSTGTGNTPTQPAAATNASGQASGTLASTKAEVKTVTATVGGNAMASVNVTFVAGAPDATQSTLVASPASGVADGTSVVTFTATINDAHGNPISGQTVSLAGTGTANSFGQPGATTNAVGQTTGTMTTTKAETKTISALIGSTTYATAIVSFVAGAPSALTSTISGTPSSVTANGVSFITFTVTIRDANSNPVSGQGVTIAATGSGNTYSQPGGSGLTDAVGQVTATLKSTKAETKTVSALIGLTVYASTTATFTVGSPNATYSTLVASPTGGTADGTSAVNFTITIKDANQNPISGLTVALASTGSGNTVTAPTGTTNGNGQITGSMVSTKAESKTVTASVSGTTYATTTVVFAPGVPSTASTMTAGTSTVANGTATITLTITIKDANGNPVPGQTVACAASGSANTLTGPAAATDASGVTTCALATTKAETKTVSASIPAISPTFVYASTTATFVAGSGSAAQSTLTASPTSGVADGTSAVTLTATIKDAYGNPVPNGAVVFASSNATDVLGATTVLTNASGVATTTVTATKAETKTLSITYGGTAFGSVTVPFVAGAASATTTTFTASTSTATTDNATTISFTTTVKDANGNPVSGQTVTLAASPNTGVTYGQPAVTDASGVAVGTVASTKAEAKTITATINGAFTKTASVTYTVGAVSAVASSISGSPANVVADGVTDMTFTVTVKDAQGNAISGQTVGLVATGTGNTITAPTGTTNSSGQIATGKVHTTKAEDKTVTFQVGGTSYSSVLVTFVAGAASSATSTITASPTSGVADNASLVTYTVTVKDANSNPISGAVVTLVSTGTGNTIGASGTTDATGRTTVTMRTSVAETKTVQFKIGTTTYTPSVAVSYVAGAPSTTTSLFTASPTSVTADNASTSTMTATIKDQFGNLVSGSTVNFTATGTGNTVTATAVTNSSGVATGTIASTKAEAKTVSALIAGTSYGSATVTFTAGTPAPLLSTLSASPNPVTADGSTATLTATIVDANGNPVANQTVAFTATGTANTFAPVGGTATTNTSGVATVTLSSTKAETKTIVAKIGTTQYGSSVSLVFNPGAPSASLSSLSVSPSSATANGSAGITVTITLKDANSNLISGVTPTISATGTGNGYIQPGATAASGIATGTVYSTKAESKTISATASGVTLSTTATVTFTPGTISATTATFTAAPGTNYADNATTSTLTFTALDAFNNLISGQAVSFAITTGTGGTLGTASGTTAAAGTLTTTLKSSLNNTITVTATAGAVTKTASVVFLPAKPVITTSSTPTSLSGCSSTSTTIQQAQGLPVDLLIEYSTDDQATWHRATQSSGSSTGVTRFPGSVHTFGWNTSADFRKSSQAIWIRKSASVTTAAGTSVGAYWSPFSKSIANGLSVAAGVGYIVEAAPTGVAVGDMNLDGYPDAVVADNTNKFVSVLLGGAGGTLTLKGSYASGKSVQNPVVADFNSDGKPDVVCGNSGSAGAVVMTGIGDGSLNTATVQTLQSGYNIRSVAVGDVDRDGDIDVVSVRRALTGGYFVGLNSGGTINGTASFVAVGANLSELALGDLNNDGILDLVMASDAATTPNLWVALGVGDGTFGAASAYNDGGGAHGVVSLALGDVNSDGKLDVVAGGDTARLAVLTGTGTGTLNTAAVTTLSGTSGNLYGLSLADLDGDGNLDAAFANGTAGVGSVLRGDGAGAFATQIDVALNTGVTYAPSGAAVGDFNLDGRPDLVVTDANGTIVTKGLAVILNTTPYDCERLPGGTLDVQVSTTPNALATGDFNKDGKPDAVVVHPTSTGPIKVLLGTGNGSFTTASTTTLAANSSPNGVTVGDYDADGNDDFAVANSGALNNVLVYKGAGDGTFSLAATIAVGAQANDVAFGNFNSTAGLDLAIASGLGTAVYVASGNGAGTFTLGTAQAISPLTGVTRIRAIDAGGDAYTDLIAGYSAQTTEALWLGSASGTFSQSTASVSTAGVYNMAAGDLNGDGLQDSVVAHQTYVSVRLATGPGTFGTASTYSSNLTAGICYSVVTGEFTGDGFVDVAVGVNNGSTTSFIAILPGNGTGALGTATTYPVPKRPTNLATLDANGDGRLDIAYVANQAAMFGVLLSAGPTGMQSGAQYSGAVAYAAAVADFDHDGNLDAAIAAATQSLVWVYSGGTVNSWTTPTWAAGISVADFNRDGNPDIATAANTANAVGVLLGSASGTFTSGTGLTTGLVAPTYLASGDFDLDGKADVVVTNETTQDSLIVATGDGTGALGLHTATIAYANGSFNPRIVVTADFDNDGDLDIANANNGTSDYIYLHTNTTSPRGGSVAPTFTSALAATLVSGFGLVAGDLNHDGKPDMVASSNAATAYVAILLNNGAGFTMTSQQVGQYLNGLQLVDVDGDGDLDIVAGSGFYGYFTVGFNDGTGSFSGWRYFGGAALSSTTNVALLATDLNRDGIPDLIGSNYAASSVTVLTGR